MKATGDLIIGVEKVHKKKKKIDKATHESNGTPPCC